MLFYKQHLRHCLLFAFQLKKNATEAKEMICSALGEDAVSYSTCKKWFQRFKSGNLDLEGEEHPGQPKKVEDEELEELLKESSCRTQSELAEALGVTQQTISKRLQKLGGIQKEGRWFVPHVLSSLENKARRCDTAMSIAMPNYSFREKADMIFMYGRANGNGCEAARLYQESFPNRQIPSSKTFASLYQRLIETGSVERNTTGYIANRVVACTSDFEDATLDDTENPDVSGTDQQRSDHMTNGKSHSSGKAYTIYKRKKSTRRSAINGKQRIAQQITFSQESTSSSEEEQESPPKRACSSRSNVNANAPLQDTNVKTQENKQTSSSSHDETSPTREPPKITCIYLKSVRPEDFLSEDQASIV